MSYRKLELSLNYFTLTRNVSRNDNGLIVIYFTQMYISITIAVPPPVDPMQCQNNTECEDYATPHCCSKVPWNIIMTRKRAALDLPRPIFRTSEVREFRRCKLTQIQNYFIDINTC